MPNTRTTRRQTGPSAMQLEASFTARRCTICGWPDVCAVCPGSEDPPEGEVSLCLTHAVAVWSNGARIHAA